jgi:hypothetical protein
MVSGVSSMAAGGMGMMSCLFVLAAFVMFGCFSVMAGCTSMMLRSLSVMFGCFFRHAMFLLLPILTYRELRRSFQIARGLERTLRPSRKFRASSGCVRAGSSLEPWHHRRKSEGQEHYTGRAPSNQMGPQYQAICERPRRVATTARASSSYGHLDGLSGSAQDRKGAKTWVGTEFVHANCE